MYYYFRKFKCLGIWAKFNQSLVTQDRNLQYKKDTPTLVSIDYQSVKTVLFISQDVGLDGNRKFNGRKRHAVVNTLGNIFGIVVHAANHFDGIKGMQFETNLYPQLEQSKSIS